MFSRFMILLYSLLMLSMQMNFTRSHSTVHSKIHYENGISVKDIRELGVLLEEKYSHYKNIFGISSNTITEVSVFNSIGRFRTESQSRIFKDGDFKSGKIYIYYTHDQNQKDKLSDVVSRVTARAVLEKIPACPGWLTEAYSLYAGNDLARFGEPARFNIATFTDIGEDFNRASNTKDIKELYAKLAATIHFLVNRYGVSKVELMLRNFKNGGSIEEVFEISFNEKLPEIERAWIRALQTNRNR